MPTTHTLDLYPRNRSSRLDGELFRNPTTEYRGTPLWSWNNRLDKAQLLQQIKYLKQMGLGGFHIHPRTGLDTPYMGPEFMEMVRACVDKAKAEGMLAWLYDEDRWPSGYGGGLVTQNERFRARHLLWTCVPYEEKGGVTLEATSLARGARGGNGTLLCRYEVVLQNGVLASYHRLQDGEGATRGGRIWYAYLEVAQPTTWYNNQTYVDTLNPQAIERFVEVTHQRYAEAIGDEFGKTVPAIFTDEPQFVHKQSFQSPDDTNDLIVPFTNDLFDTYYSSYGQRLEDSLPELFWELPERQPSLTRYRYHDHVCERFTQAFADTIGDWCKENGLFLTGHMMDESNLHH